MRDRYQRAQIHDLGSKWKLFYWDYTRTPRQRRTKTWTKSKLPSHREAQRLADQFMEKPAYMAAVRSQRTHHINAIMRCASESAGELHQDIARECSTE